MENSTGTYEWEYYYDYIEPVIVDESKLKYHKYSVIIIFWISLSGLVGFLFLTLNLMSHMVSNKCLFETFFSSWVTLVQMI
uniref:Melanocortin 2 receptor accessory protein n=1 Tax=Takifugu rubripes TaxID=31033 RepID=A0A3B5K409_TAKRU